MSEAQTNQGIILVQSSTNTVERPKAISELQVQKFIAKIKQGCTVAVACRLSGIARSTYYAELARNQELQDRVTAAQELLSSYAMDVITRSIRCGNVKTAQWYIERQDRREFHAQRVTEYRTMKKLIITETQTVSRSVEVET